ncbi:helix-turn-helix domain-containing protein [Actinomycetospora cinnamomea]|uniref:Excisionase family DNA binding protein n=1 Tax=Actinomycetospora cinnamomea TaxID=663609 RepID=A0A2U1FA62_9PSEU|nr:helix-turn-helix domain-containing protein [Actinomycetospora cinnamomea]PVZ09056.1 excisionase family DNA binding protein [Actinomycetospora cinnamomea]
MTIPVTDDAAPADALVLAYTPDEVAHGIRVPVRQVDDAIRRGELKAIRVGRHRRITPAAVDEYLARLTGR